MQKRSMHNPAASPILGRVILFAQSFIRLSKEAPKDVKHPFCDDIRKDICILFKYANRELTGKDYIKRTIDLLEEIHAELYLIYALGGLTKKSVALLDCDIVGILESLQQHRQNAYVGGTREDVND